MQRCHKINSYVFVLLPVDVTSDLEEEFIPYMKISSYSSAITDEALWPISNHN